MVHNLMEVLEEVDTLEEVEELMLVIWEVEVEDPVILVALVYQMEQCWEQ